MSDDAGSAGWMAGAVAARRTGSFKRLAGGGANTDGGPAEEKRACSDRLSWERRLVPGRGWPLAEMTSIVKATGGLGECGWRPGCWRRGGGRGMEGSCTNTCSWSAAWRKAAEHKATAAWRKAAHQAPSAGKLDAWLASCSGGFEPSTCGPADAAGRPTSRRSVVTPTQPPHWRGGGVSHNHPGLGARPAPETDQRPCCRPGEAYDMLHEPETLHRRSSATKRCCRLSDASRTMKLPKRRCRRKSYRKHARSQTAARHSRSAEGVCLQYCGGVVKGDKTAGTTSRPRPPRSQRATAPVQMHRCPGCLDWRSRRCRLQTAGWRSLHASNPATRRDTQFKVRLLRWSGRQKHQLYTVRPTATATAFDWAAAALGPCHPPVPFRKALLQRKQGFTLSTSSPVLSSRNASAPAQEPALGDGASFPFQFECAVEGPGPGLRC